MLILDLRSLMRLRSLENELRIFDRALENKLRLETLKQELVWSCLKKALKDRPGMYEEIKNL